MKIFVEQLVPDSAMAEACCQRIIARVLRAEGYAGYSLTLVLADSAYLRRLNRRFRRIDRATDVISFSLQEGPPSPVAVPELGDIYISVPRARRQARQYRVTPQEEMARLIIHGVLHLLGYDHIRARQARAMHALEDLYLGSCRGQLRPGPGAGAR